MAAAEVVVVDDTEDDGAIGEHGGRGRSLVHNLAGAGGVGGGVYTHGGSRSAGISDRGADGQKHAAAVVQNILQRGCPFGREVGIHRDQVGNHGVEVGHARGVDGFSIGRNGRGDVHAGTLRAAQLCRRNRGGGGRPGEWSAAGAEEGSGAVGGGSSRSGGHESGVSDRGESVVGRDLDQPGVGDIVLSPGIGGHVELDHVEINVAAGVGGERARDEGIGGVRAIHGSERGDLRDGSALGFVHFPN